VMKGLCWSVVAGSVIIDQLPGQIGSGWQLQMMRVEIGRDGITLGEARRRQAGSIAAQRLVTRACAMTSAVVARLVHQMLLARMSPGQ
jgi:hypothetical protein